MSNRECKKLNPVQFSIVENVEQTNLYEATVPPDVLVQGKQAVLTWIRENIDAWEPVHCLDESTTDIQYDTLKLENE